MGIFLMTLSKLPCSWREGRGCELLQGVAATPYCWREGGSWFPTEAGKDTEANICASNVASTAVCAVAGEMWSQVFN